MARTMTTARRLQLIMETLRLLRMSETKLSATIHASRSSIA